MRPQTSLMRAPEPPALPQHRHPHSQPDLGTRRVPSENTLAQEYGVARGTAKKALDSLVEAGLVRRVQGRGTFVA